MKKTDTLKTAALILAAFIFGCFLASYSDINKVRFKRLERAYQIEKARADASRVLIDQIMEDWDEFYDSTGEGDAFFNWLDAEEMKY